MKGFARRIKAARGDLMADLLIRNAKLINVFSHEIMLADVAVREGRFLGWGRYRAREIIDLEGKYLSPGFIDGHCHIESSMLVPRSFARAVVPRGTTTVVADPHEITNVLGIEGIRFMLENARGVPLDLYLMLSSCVPATSMETAGASLDATEIALLIDQPWSLGLGEVMNFPGVIHGVPSVLEKIRAARDKVIDGHAPGVFGEALNAYIMAGIRSDHESIDIEEAREKLQKGMTVMIREGTAAKNLEDIAPLITADNARRFILVTDDRHPTDLIAEGHIDSVVQKAISQGLDPITCIQMVTLNPAESFRIPDLGAIAPGYRADAVVIEDLKAFSVSMVIKGGRVVAKNGEATYRKRGKSSPLPLRSLSVGRLDRSSLEVKAGRGKMNVIGVLPDQIVTEHLRMRSKVVAGLAISDIERDILKIAVVERHHGSGNIGLGFVRGLGLKRGAMATSVAHDSHNILCVGTSDSEMLRAIREVVQMGGGEVLVEGNRVASRLPLPIGGLMSAEPAQRVAQRAVALRKGARQRGCLPRDPFMTLSFLALPVIPNLKITDKGLVDVKAFRRIALFG